MIGLWLGRRGLRARRALARVGQIALLALVLVIIASVIEGNILSPRLLGHAVGVHPLVSLFFLLAFAELFGLWGALFAAPDRRLHPGASRRRSGGSGAATIPNSIPRMWRRSRRGRASSRSSNGAAELPAPAHAQEAGAPPAIDPAT